MEELRVELTQVHRTCVDETGASLLGHHPNILKPSQFMSSRVMKDVDKLTWSMATYFKTAGIEDGCARVGMISMYLTNVALLWLAM